MATPRDENIYRAKLAEQAERYSEMVDFMKKVAAEREELTVEERNLLSVAYKNEIGARRASWRIISSIEQKEENKGNAANVKIIKEYRHKVEGELNSICNDVLAVLSDHLIPKAKQPESQVFYNKMKGDYYRYLAEFSTDTKKSESSDKSLEAYGSAWETAKELATTHPIRLGLALNYSVFFYEIRNDADKAIKLAKNAFDDAIAKLDSLSEDSYKDATLILQLLRDNMTLWSSDMQNEGGPVSEEKTAN